jgi:hypothetical protein
MFSGPRGPVVSSITVSSTAWVLTPSPSVAVNASV